MLLSKNDLLARLSMYAWLGFLALVDRRKAVKSAVNKLYGLARWRLKPAV